MAEPAARDDGAARAALDLYADVLAAASLDAAAHRLAAQLARVMRFDRVSIGLHDNGRTRLLASTDLDVANPRAELAELVVGAMDEAIEQAQPLVAGGAPPAGGTGATAADGTPGDVAIGLEHQLLQRHVGGTVATVPLGVDGAVFAAVCAERQHGAAPDGAELERLTQLLALAAPALRWMALGELPWHRRMRRAAAGGWHVLRRPDKRLARNLLAVGLLALAFAALAPLEHAVGGRARIEGAQQRVLSAPTDGFIKAAHVRPGDRVQAGAALVELIEEDLQLERERWVSQLAQHENAYAAAMAKSDRVGASTSFARVDEAQAQLALIEQLRARGRITAPFDALVVQGDLSQSVGAPVRQGDALLTLASTDAYRVVIQIDETDIGHVAPGQEGQLVVSALPWQDRALVVERITPLARAVEGRNVFEVHARLRDGAQSLRPGLIGRAEVVVGRTPPLWAWLRQLAARVQVAWWSWLG